MKSPLAGNKAVSGWERIVDGCIGFGVDKLLR
jgi:hypothetical protein